MNIYLLVRIKPYKYTFDFVEGFVIRASSEGQARHMANDYLDIEDRPAGYNWTGVDYAKCELIGTTDDLESKILMTKMDMRQR